VPIAAAVAAIFVAGFIGQVALPAATGLTNGFSAYYTAARLVRSGADVAHFYDDSWFQAQTLAFGFGNARDIFNVNPPATALLLWPIAGLDPVAAKAVWTGLNLVFIALALVILAGLTESGPVVGLFAVALLTLFQPLREEIRLGQAYALVLLLEALFLRAYRRQQSGLAGLAIALMLTLKSAGLALPLLLISSRRWSVLAWTVGLVGGIVALTLPIVGAAAWLTYVRLLALAGSHAELAVPAYQSVVGFSYHLFRPDLTWNPTPLFPWSDASTFVAVALAAALIGITFIATSRANLKVLEVRAASVVAWATLSLILSPAAADYHYAVLIAPIALLAFAWRNSERGWRSGLALLLGVLLVGAPLPYRSPAFAAGPFTLLAYPKLYGGLLLWGVAVAIVRGSGADRRSLQTRRRT
jgi:hypothetical protein